MPSDEFASYFEFKDGCKERDEAQSKLDEKKAELEFAKRELELSQKFNQQLNAQIGTRNFRAESPYKPI